MAGSEAFGGGRIRERRHGFDAHLAPVIALAMKRPTFSAASTRCASARWAQPAVVRYRRCEVKSDPAVGMDAG